MFKALAFVVVSVSCCGSVIGPNTESVDEPSASSGGVRIAGDSGSVSAPTVALSTFKHDVEPLLTRYCFDCHRSGTAEGNLTLDALDSAHDLADPSLWLTSPSPTFYAEGFLGGEGRDGEATSFYPVRTVKRDVTIPADGDYLIHAYIKVDGGPAPRDPQECIVHGTVGNAKFFTEQFQWANNNLQNIDCNMALQPIEQETAFTTEPIHSEPEKQRIKKISG